MEVTALQSVDAVCYWCLAHGSCHWTQISSGYNDGVTGSACTGRYEGGGGTVVTNRAVDLDGSVPPEWYLTGEQGTGALPQRSRGRIQLSTALSEHLD